MLLGFTEVITNNTISVNPEYVVAVFTVVDGEHQGKTAISVINGNIIVQESYLDVVGNIRGAQV
jgi:hypothetical protein